MPNKESETPTPEALQKEFKELKARYLAWAEKLEWADNDFEEGEARQMMAKIKEQIVACKAKMREINGQNG
ncbi:MAG: hypothetical protein GXO33_01290 [Epsilonproteobacteria bacterium]|nr:hypothetical protein [Campylobacterota bacterium]